MICTPLVTMKSTLINRLSALVLLSFALVAPAGADVSISNLDPISVNAWAGATSDLTGSDTFCTISCQGGCNRASHRRDYDTAAYTNGASDGAGNFYISNGSDTMLVYLDWTHPVDGTVRLTNYSVTGDTTGLVEGAYSCADPNSQTRIDITLPAGELASAQAGTYSETFLVDACRIGGFFYAECTARVPFSVTLPELVQISRLDNLNLGTWDGVNDIQVTEQFCVFRNGSGGFSIMTNSANASGGNFNLTGASTVPYTIEYAQSGGYFSVAPGVRLSSGTTGFVGEGTRNCGGANNTSIRVTVDAADLAGQPGGSFSDTIILTVEPD